MVAKIQEAGALEARAGRRVSHDVLGKSFLVAHLLTGSASQAERAVERAIDICCPTPGIGKRLFEVTLQLAVSGRIGLLVSMEQDRTTDVVLPPELRRVLTLPRRLRYCFVLRVLVGMSPRTCASILHLSAPEVNQYSCRAIKHLSVLAVALTK